MKRIILFLALFELSLIIGCNPIDTNLSDVTEKIKFNGTQNINTKSDYNKFIEKFIKVEVNDIYELQEEGLEFFLYIGRETCPYCKEFVPKLVEASEDSEVYYLDSIDSYENSSQHLKDFRDCNTIENVPSFILFEGYEIKDRLEITANLDVKDIFKFLYRNN